MEIFIKLFIGFAIFFTGVVFNVSVMSKTDGRAKGFLPLASFLIICAGLVVLVAMASSISVNV
jgi:vacuolar-type H+-ATPase subunit I/STV1